MEPSKNRFKLVYRQTQLIPAGKVTTYGEIARILGWRDVRLVGYALHANKRAAVPCHRVVNKLGGLAPNFAFDGAMEQRRRLEVEGVVFIDEMTVDLKQCMFRFEGHQ